MYAADTDMTPFDVGAYASSTTYVSGMAVKKAAETVHQQIATRAAIMLDVDSPGEIDLRDRAAFATDGRSVTLEESRPAFAPSGRPAPDHGNCVLCGAGITSAVRGPVRRESRSISIPDR